MHAIVPIIESKNKIKDINRDFKIFKKDFVQKYKEIYNIDSIERVDSSYHPEVLSLEKALEDTNNFLGLMLVIINGGEDFCLSQWQEYQKMVFSSKYQDLTPKNISSIYLLKASKKVLSDFKSVLQTLIKFHDYSNDLAVFYVSAHFF